MTHYAGSIMADIRRAVNADPGSDTEISNVQGNGAHGVHQALVTIDTHGLGGDKHYRLILAPVDAPIMVGTLLAEDHFANPLVSA